MLIAASFRADDCFWDCCRVAGEKSGSSATKVHQPAEFCRAMTIREIGAIRGILRPIETVGTARVSRNVDLIANGVGLDAGAPSRRPIGRRILFCTIV